MKRIRLAVLTGTAAVGLALTACGTDPGAMPGADRGVGPTSGARANDNTSGRVSRPTATPELAAADTAVVGLVATDELGRTLYRFDKDTAAPSKSNCLADCAVQWPPALVGKGHNLRLAGVDPRLVGRVARPDGTLQLTLAGWPLYAFAKDEQAGDTLGHGVGGVWFAATPEGTRAKATSPRTYQPQHPEYSDGYGY